MTEAPEDLFREMQGRLKERVAVSVTQEEFETLALVVRRLLSTEAASVQQMPGLTEIIAGLAEMLDRQDSISFPLQLNYSGQAWFELSVILKNITIRRPEAGEEPGFSLSRAKRSLMDRIGKSIRTHNHEKGRGTSPRGNRLIKLGAQELYHYGTLLALAVEQSEALADLASGRLSWLAKRRISSRSEAMLKQLFAIMKLKKADRAREALGEVIDDLEAIHASGLEGRTYPDGAFRTLRATIRGALEA